MGRWKTGPGGAYYDSQDSGPDQVTPPPAAPQPPAPQAAEATAEPPQASAVMQPWQGPISIDFGQDGGYQWGSPGDPQRRIGGSSQLLEFLASMGLRKPAPAGVPEDGMVRSQVMPPQPGANRGGLPLGSMATGGMTAMGKASSGLGMLGRGLFGR